MKFLLLALALMGDPGAATDETCLPAETINDVAKVAQTGMIIASRGECLAVRVTTQSRYTHVGSVVVQNGKAVVYDSMIGVGVRCLPLDEYLESQRPCDIELFHPTKPFTQTQCDNFQHHLHEQLGRPYGVKQYVTGRQGRGVHCAEYLSEALIASDHITVENPALISPAELLRCLTKHEIYASGDLSNLPAVPVADPPRASTWYGRAWQDTKQCSRGCWTQTKRWVLSK